MDLPQPSRWSKDTRAEFEGSAFEDCQYAQENILKPLREVHNGPFGLILGNHDERIADYMEKHAPALAGPDGLTIEKMLNLYDFNIPILPEVHDVAPGWVATHGHRGGVRLSQIAGMTALNAARKFGKSVVCGHTHRLTSTHHTGGYSGAPHTISGMEVGHFVNVPLAGYLKGSMPNWQAGFGLLTIDGTHVRADAVPVLNGKFVVEGVSYKC